MKKHYLQIIAGAVGIFALDQLLKNYSYLHFSPPLQLTNWLFLRYEQNFGIAWSIPLPHTLLLLLNIAILFAMPIYFLKYLDTSKLLSKITLALFIGGALGNTFDRIFRGYVIDFISVGSFPVFNLADSALCTGIFLIFLFYGKIKRN